MLRSISSPFLTPDDFSVPCRLRRREDSSSSCDENCQNGQAEQSQQLSQQAEEYTCTMRKWHKETNTASDFVSPLRRNKSECQTKVHDAELILSLAHCYNRGRCISGELSKTSDTNTPIPFSKRFASFGTPNIIDNDEKGHYSWSSSTHQRSVESAEQRISKEVTIPVKDIIRVLTRGEDVGDNVKRKLARKDLLREESCQQPSICITTSTSGTYELLMESTNEQLVVKTFIQVNSGIGKVSFVTGTDDDEHLDCNQKNKRLKIKYGDDTDNIVDESGHNDANNEDNMNQFKSMVLESGPSDLTHGTSHSNGSFDMEAFTAKRMNERLKTESLTEKLERRLHRIISSIDEITSTFANCACGCFSDSAVYNINIEKEMAPRSRRNTESTVSLSDNGKTDDDPETITDDLPMSRSASPIQPTSDQAKSRYESFAPLKEEAVQAHSQLRMPSGLSLSAESDEYMDDVPLFGDNYYTELMRPRAVPVMASDV